MPEALIVAGPNGAGKTTLALEYRDVLGHVYLSADAIAAELRPDEPTEAHVQAGRLFIRRLATCIDDGTSFIAESTLAGRSFERVLERLQRAGFTTRITFIFLDSPELCVRRVQQRVLHGGHHVPREDVVRRFHRSKHNFWHVYRKCVDQWLLLYNAGEQLEEVAAGEATRVVVSDEGRFSLFLTDLSSDSDA